MATQRSEQPKIDRLSSLPPELLLSIFDLVDNSHQPLLEPSSKQLLPYFYQHLYHRIHLTSRNALTKLLHTASVNSSLALLVRELILAGNNDLQSAEIEVILSMFPSLVSFQPRFFGSFHHCDWSLNKPLPRLKHLSYECEHLSEEEVGALARFPLQSLELEVSCAAINLPPPLPHLKSIATLVDLSLVIARNGEDRATELARFVARCPELERLRLRDEDWPGFGLFLEELTRITPSKLLSLKLESTFWPDEIQCTFAHLFPLFRNLTYLSLDTGFTCPSLSTHLQQLSHLVTLRLGPDAHFGFDSPEDLLSFVRTQTQPPSLEHLILDCFEGDYGPRFDVDDPVDDAAIGLTGWELPKFRSLIDVPGCEALIDTAAKAGISVEGSVHEALDIVRAYRLEVANRHVLWSFQHQDLDPLEFPGRYYNERFHVFDFESLDPSNLHLVKIDLPEEGWFQLTLK